MKIRVGVSNNNIANIKFFDLHIYIYQQCDNAECVSLYTYIKCEFICSIFPPLLSTHIPFSLSPVLNTYYYYERVHRQT